MAMTADEEVSRRKKPPTKWKNGERGALPRRPARHKASRKRR